jgi:hypothetical protein
VEAPNPDISTGMVLSAIWKKTYTSEFFKDYQNCTESEGRVQFDVFEKLMRNHTKGLLTEREVCTVKYQNEVF